MTNTTMKRAAVQPEPVLPPGPKGHPLLGMMREFRQDRLTFYRQMGQVYGDVIRLRMLWVDTYAVSHPDYVKYILQDNNRNYRRNTFVNSILKLFLGEGLFTLDGESWLSRRRLVQPAFHRQRIVALSTIMTDAADALLAAWATAAPVQLVAVDEAMMALTLRVVGRALFSVDLLGEARTLGDAFTAVSEYVSYRMQVPFPPPLFVPTRRNRHFKAALATLDQTIYALINDRRRAQANGAVVPDDLLTMLMAARDEETGRGMTDAQLRNEVLLLMFAGHETTATTLTWAFYLLSQYPAAATKLQEELDRVLEGRTPTLDDLPNLPYNRMVIEETMRLYPPAWAVARQSVEVDVVGGYRLPANASITLPINTLHRDPRWWEEPDRFEPERFTPERSANRHKFAYLPFGAGPRQCIGNHFAMMEAQLVLATVASRYQLRLRPGHPVAPDPVFVLRTSHGLPMTVTPRAGAAVNGG